MQAELCDELWAGNRHVPQWVSDIIRARFIGGKRQSAVKKKQRPTHGVLYNIPFQ
jgi:hypothetical protein